MWDLIVSVPDHCLSFYFSFMNASCSISVHFNSGFYGDVAECLLTCGGSRFRSSAGAQGD